MSVVWWFRSFAQYFVVVSHWKRSFHSTEWIPLGKLENLKWYFPIHRFHACTMQTRIPMCRASDSPMTLPNGIEWICWQSHWRSFNAICPLIFKSYHCNANVVCVERNGLIEIVYLCSEIWYSVNSRHWYISTIQETINNQIDTIIRLTPALNECGNLIQYHLNEIWDSVNGSVENVNSMQKTWYISI